MVIGPRARALIAELGYAINPEGNEEIASASSVYLDPGRRSRVTYKGHVESFAIALRGLGYHAAVKDDQGFKSGVVSWRIVLWGEESSNPPGREHKLITSVLKAMVGAEIEMGPAIASEDGSAVLRVHVNNPWGRDITGGATRGNTARSVRVCEVCGATLAETMIKRADGWHCKCGAEVM